METMPDDKIALGALDVYLSHTIKKHLIQALNNGEKDPELILFRMNQEIKKQVQEHSQANFKVLMAQAIELVKTETAKTKTNTKANQSSEGVSGQVPKQ